MVNKMNENEEKINNDIISKNDFKMLSKITNLNFLLETYIINFPKNERVLTYSIKKSTYDLVRYANSYNINTKKLYREKNLYDLLIELSMIDYYILLSYTKKYLKKGQLDKLNNIIIEIRKIAYSLYKYVSGTK